MEAVALADTKGGDIAARPVRVVSFGPEYRTLESQLGAVMMTVQAARRYP